jgi:hypothetical protein
MSCLQMCQNGFLNRVNKYIGQWMLKLLPGYGRPSVDLQITSRHNPVKCLIEEPHTVSWRLFVFILQTGERQIGLTLKVKGYSKHPNHTHRLNVKKRIL